MKPLPPWDRATAAVMILAALLIGATFRDYGATWDERFQRAVGQAAVAWWTSAGADTRALEGGETGNLNLYGGLFEGLEEVAAASLPFHPLESRHLVNALLALVGVAGAALLARRLGGPRAGFLAAVLLLTTPGWWGHGFANSKDVPFAAPFPWMLLALLWAADEFPRPRARRVVLAGLALGACLAARPGGLVLLLPLVAFVVAVRAFPVIVAAGGARSRVAATIVGRLALIFAIAWAAMLLAWPYGLLNPFSGPIEAIAQARTHPWNGLVRFAGAWHLSTDLPRSYAPTWLLATLPESWFAIVGTGAIAATVAWRRDRLRPVLEAAWLDPVLVAAAGFGPILAAVVTRPVLYDGIRHLLFILPALAALAGWVLSAAIDRLPPRAGRVALGLTAGLAALAVVDAVRLHPYQYVYFNRAVAGGLAGASRDYELDYWGATGREAMAWVVRNIPPKPGRPITVGTTADPFVASSWIERDPVAMASFSFAPAAPPDLRLATTRWYGHRATGRVLHVVERMGVPLLYVIESTGDGGLVLDAGDRAVELALPPGWYGEPELQPGDERARYLLRRQAGTPAEVQAIIVTPRIGPLPGAHDLHAAAAGLTAELLGLSPSAIEPQPVIGETARGWIATGEAATAQGTLFVGGAAVVVGDVAVTLQAQHLGDSAKSAREFLDLARGIRAVDADQRVP